MALYLSAVRIAVLFSMHKFISYPIISLKFSLLENHNKRIVVYLSFGTKTDLCTSKLIATHYFILYFLHFLYNPRIFSDYTLSFLFFLTDSEDIETSLFSSSSISFRTSSTLSALPANEIPSHRDHTLPSIALTAVATRSSISSIIYGAKSTSISIVWDALSNSDGLISAKADTKKFTLR